MRTCAAEREAACQREHRYGVFAACFTQESRRLVPFAECSVPFAQYAHINISELGSTWRQIHHQVCVCVCVSRCKRYALKGTQPDSPQNAAGFPPMLRNGKRGKTSQASGKTLKVPVHSRQNTNGLKVELHIFAYIRPTGKGRLRSS